MQKVAVNEFVRRQIKGSGKTYSPDLSFEEIVKHAAARMDAGNFKEGYRKGVRIVSGSKEIAEKFICPFAKINENTELVSNMVTTRRRALYSNSSGKCKTYLHWKSGIYPLWSRCFGGKQ